MLNMLTGTLPTIVISCITPSPQIVVNLCTSPKNFSWLIIKIKIVVTILHTLKIVIAILHTPVVVTILHTPKIVVAILHLGVCSIATTILIKFLYYQPREPHCKWPPIANLPISVLILVVYSIQAQI